MCCWLDKHGKTLDFKLSRRCNQPAATKFFARMWEINGLPRKIVIDKSGANTAGIGAINKMLKSFGCPIPIEMVRRKYLNNIIEQDHRFIKRRIRLMLGFKSFAAAASALAGIELVTMIRKGQFTPGLRPFQQFIQLAGQSPLQFRLCSSQRNLRQNPKHLFLVLLQPHSPPYAH